MDTASPVRARPASFFRRLLGDLLRLAPPRSAGLAREASKFEVLHLVDAYETEFDAMCVRMAAGFTFVAARDRLSPLFCACNGLIPGESGLLRAVMGAHGAVVTQLFMLPEPIDSAGGATDASRQLAELRDRHAAAVQRVRAHVQRL